MNAKPSLALQAHKDAIRRVVETHGGRNPRVFGSAATGADTEASDLDLLVDPTAEMTLLDIGAMRVELSAMLGVSVEVLTPGALPERIRGAVLDKATPL